MDRIGTGSKGLRRLVAAMAIVLGALLMIGVGTPAQALSGSSAGCPGSVDVVPYSVVRLSAGYQAYMPARRVLRSPCYAGRQIIQVTYREYTGFPDATRWSLQETGPGNNSPAAWYVYPGQSLPVPVWNGGFFTKDIVSVDMKVEWFTDSWAPLGSMYLDYDRTSDYRCLSGYCTIHTSPIVGAYVYYR
jgi:hypothetical protein